MAISSVTNRVNYQANGTSAVFNFGYQFDAAVELQVFLFNSSASAANNITPQVLNTHFTISSAAQTVSGIYKFGADVIFNSTPNAQSVVVMFRSSVLTNTFTLPAQIGGWPSGLDAVLDHITLSQQRLQDQTTRSLRMPDGMFANFDPTLPANLLQSSGKRLIVNSSATGWTFDESLGSYITNTVVVAITNSTITSLGGASAGLVLQSNGSSAPSWGAVSLGSGAVPASSISGILPVANGGTGTGTSYTQFGLIYASSATQLGTVPSATAGYLLTANGSSAPSFQPFGANEVASGIVSVSFGGTGTGTSYTQFGAVFMSSALQMAATAAGGGDVPLVGNPTAAPSFRALNLASGSSVTGILSNANGGTGVISLAPQFGVLYMSSATQVAVVPSAASGQFLQSNGSSAPSFAAVSVSPVATISKTANYVATTADDTIFVSSSNFTIFAYPASGNSGRKLTIKKTDNYNGSSIVIIGSSSLINSSATMTMNFQFEQLGLISDGVNWLAQRGFVPKAVTYLVISGSSAGTYTKSSGVTWIRVRGTGGGGGGGGTGTSGQGAGGNGGPTHFGSSLLSALGGSGGGASGGGAGNGGSASFSTAVAGFVLAGGGGSAGATTSITLNTHGGNGGSGPLGGAGPSGTPGSAGGAAGTDTGGGGGGAGGAAASFANAAGGGSGGYFEGVISNPAATYPYIVGGPGVAGAAGASGAAGGAGGGGRLIIEEGYT